MMPINSISLRPNQSLVIIHNTAEDKKAIEQKQSVLWECIGRTFDRDGFIYHYRRRALPQAQSVAEQKESFPATEGLNEESVSTLMNHHLDKFGYSYMLSDSFKICLNLPDRDFLQARLKEFYPEFTETIVSSEGIADDLSFVKAFLKYFILLSDGKEFLHDHTAHAIVMLKTLIDDSVQLIKAMKNWRALISDVLQKVENADILKIDRELKKRIMTMIGAGVDSLWANSYSKVADPTIDGFVFALPMRWNNEFYQYYWKRIYGEDINIARAQALWDKAFPRARL